jgi:hypothetical protein
MPTPSRRPASSTRNEPAEQRPTTSRLAKPGAKPPGSDRVTKPPSSARLAAARPDAAAAKPGTGATPRPGTKAPSSARLQAAAPKPDAPAAKPGTAATPRAGTKAPSSARLQAAAPKPEPGAHTKPASDRVTKPAAKPSSGTTAAAGKPGARPASGTVPAAAPTKPTARSGRPASGTTPAARPSARHRTAGADDKADAKDAKAGRSARRSTRTEAGRPAADGGKRKWLMIAVAAVIVLTIGGFAAAGPVMQSLRMSTMKAGTDASKLPAALAATDLWCANATADQVHALLTQDSGLPPEVAVRLGKDAKTPDDLLALAVRDGLPDAARADALAAAVAVWNDDKHPTLPKQLQTWTTDPKEDDAVAAAAISVLAHAGGADANAQLLALLGTQGLADARLDAACAAFAKSIVDHDVIPGALGLLTGPNAARILKHPDLLKAITDHCVTEDFDHLMTYARAPDQDLRVFALRTISTQCPLYDGEPNDAAREKLAAEFAKRLVPATPADELAATLAAASKLTLTQASDAILALAPDAMALSHAGLDQNAFADCLGKALILGKTKASKDATTAHIGRLIAALDQPRTHALAAVSLGRIANPDLLPDLRPALAKLADAGDPDAIAALTALVRQTFARKDIVDANGASADKWKAWVATDAHDSARLAEMMQWQTDNVQYQRVSDGKDRLQANADWLDKAIPELDAWLANPAWLPPLNGTRTGATDLQGKLKMLKRTVGQALAGAKEG